MGAPKGAASGSVGRQGCCGARTRWPARKLHFHRRRALGLTRCEPVIQRTSRLRNAIRFSAALIFLLAASSMADAALRSQRPHHPGHRVRPHDGHAPAAPGRAVAPRHDLPPSRAVVPQRPIAERGALAERARALIEQARAVEQPRDLLLGASTLLEARLAKRHTPSEESLRQRIAALSRELDRRGVEAHAELLCRES